MTLTQSPKEARWTATFTCIVFSILLVLATPSNADLKFIGPSRYSSAADSPFRGLDFDYFHLEDFEDLNLNTPGVTRSAGTVGEEARAYRDSVDGDDGAIDGLGTEGESLFADRGRSLWDWLPWSDADATGVTFTFDLHALGAFPSHVGVIWTDAEAPKATSIFLEAFGPTGISLGTFGPHLVGDNTTQGTTPEDRFLGVIHLNGISAVRIFQHADQIEVDHLQYGHLKAEAQVRPRISTDGLNMRDKALPQCPHILLWVCDVELRLIQRRTYIVWRTRSPCGRCRWTRGAEG